MKLNRIDLKKIQYEFNSKSNRLLQTDFADYLGVLKKYINYLKETPLIIDFINDCGECEQDIAQEVNEVCNGYGSTIFDVGETEKEEIRNVFAILKYIADNNIEIHYGVAMGYAYSNNYQDMIKSFNERFVMILIRYIESFLTKIGIEMGLDEKIVYNVSVKNGQAIFAGDNATVTATNHIGIDSAELKKLISDVVANLKDLSPAEKEEVNESIEVIEQESQSEKPKKSFIKTAIKTLSAIKGTAEFAAAVAALVEFIARCFFS